MQQFSRDISRLRSLTDSTQAVVLVGHGSRQSNAGAAMIRLAARVRANGIAPICTAAFLQHSRPTFAEALSRCASKGATDVVVLPYFFGPSSFVRDDLPRLVERARLAHPQVSVRLAQPLGDHPSLAQLVQQRATEADYLYAHPEITVLGPRRVLVKSGLWRPLYSTYSTALLMIAHGGQDFISSQPIYAVAERIRERGLYAAVAVGFMDISRPTVAEAIERVCERGVSHVITVPYFLQRGVHVSRDVPALIAAARAEHPQTTIIQAEYLGYDRLLLAVISDRIAEVISRPPRRGPRRGASDQLSQPGA